jgi:hypothetical protein
MVFLCLMLGLVGCQDHSQPKPLDDLAKQGSIEVVYPSGGDDGAPKVQVSPPDPKSPRGQALAAIEHGTHFVLYSLRPREYPRAQESKYEYGTKEYNNEAKRYLDAWNEKKEESCKGGKCLYLNPVLGKVEPLDQKDVEILKITLRSALGKVPDYAAACIAEYRHAISFVSDDKSYDILLCYHCGQVGVVVNGKEGFAEQTYGMGSQSDLDAMLTKAGIPLAPKPTW